jgi:serine/threonine protein kinase
VIWLQDIDVRVDVWALGLIFCEILTGKHPFLEHHHIQRGKKSSSSGASNGLSQSEATRASLADTRQRMSKRDLSAFTEAICGKEIPPPKPPGAKELPREIVDVIHRCLKKNPRDRYPDAGAIEDFLRDIRQTTATASAASGDPASSAAPLNTWTVEQLVLVVEKCGYAEVARKVDFPSLLAGWTKILER